MNALVTGGAGQDGFYLCHALHREGHEVHGLYRGQGEDRLSLLEAEMPFVRWHRGDMTDSASLVSVVRQVQPDLIFNLAACSYVGLSWQMPKLYMETNTIGVLNLLEAAKHTNAHIVQASTSEMYGNSSEMLNEDSPMVPQSPYGVSKLAAHRLCQVYRESYGMHVSCAISFNHESPRRPPVFVSRKVTQAAARGNPVSLGNIAIERDWGFAGDYVEAYIAMAQAPEADDYVVATGKSHSLHELVETAYYIAGTQLKIYTETSDRAAEVWSLRANPSKIERKLGWKARTSFKELIEMMVEADREKVLA